ncbi:MAG: GNAT family N-acetyltransferase [Oscillibacter sp.]|nr:GNAT family N-acetyltransferase [Oscillibacter sp.]
MNTVRRAENRDIPDILRLLVQVDMVHHNGRPDLFKGPAVKYTEEQLRVILTDPDTPVFVCTDEADQVLGYVFGIFKQYKNDNILTDIRTLYIDDLCVDEAARGRGVGKTLYEFAVQFARETGCYNLTLNVWALNEGARRFYEKCGLVPQKYGMETIL